MTTNTNRTLAEATETVQEAYASHAAWTEPTAHNLYTNTDGTVHDGNCWRRKTHTRDPDGWGRATPATAFAAWAHGDCGCVPAEGIRWDAGSEVALDAYTMFRHATKYVCVAQATASLEHQVTGRTWDEAHDSELVGLATQAFLLQTGTGPHAHDDLDVTAPLNQAHQELTDRLWNISDHIITQRADWAARALATHLVDQGHADTDNALFLNTSRLRSVRGTPTAGRYSAARLVEVHDSHLYREHAIEQLANEDTNDVFGHVGNQNGPFRSATDESQINPYAAAQLRVRTQGETAIVIHGPHIAIRTLGRIDKAGITIVGNTGPDDGNLRDLMDLILATAAKIPIHDVMATVRAIT